MMSDGGMALDIRVAPTGALGPAERAEIIDLCERAYGESFSGLFRETQPVGHVLGRCDGRLICHAAWAERSLQPDGLDPLRTAYVEAVATTPQRRGRGYASALLRRLADEVADYDLAALSPAADHIGLYRRLGWTVWEGPLSVRTGFGLRATHDERVMVLRLPGSPALDPGWPLSAEWRPGELW